MKVNHGTTAGAPGARQYSDEERSWQGDLVCQIMSSANVVDELLSARASGVNKDATFDYNVFKQLESTFFSLKKVLNQYQLKPGAKYYAAFINALTFNMQCLADLPNRPSEASISWERALEAAHMLLDDVDERVSSSSEVYHALVCLLCQSTGQGGPDPGAVMKALSVVYSKGSNDHLVFPATLATILDAATASLDDKLLSRVLSELEHVMRLPSNQPKDTSVDDTAVLLRARIFAHCRLREGFQALKLLRTLHSLDKMAPRSVYMWIASSLYLSQPHSDWSRSIVKDPATTVEFLLQEMKKDGLKIDTAIISHFMRLFTKAVRNTVDDNHSDAMLRKMERFVESCGKNDAAGKKRVIVDELIVRELVKAHCFANDPEGALDIATNSKTLYGVKPSAMMFEPIVFKLSALDEDVEGANKVIQNLHNQGILATPAIVGSIVIGLLKNHETKDALDCVQDMYNLHGVRPSTSVWTMLLDASLSVGDVAEARRVVVFIRQLYSDEEREQLVGPRSDKYVEKSVDDLKPSLSESSSAGYQLANEDNASIKEVDSERQQAVDSFWNPIAKLADMLGVSSSSSSKPGARAPMVSTHGYLLQHSVPVGQGERAVLGDAALVARFKRFGFTLVVK